MSRDRAAPTPLGEAILRSPESLHQLAKLAELGQQVAVVVHELSQPLLGVKAFAQILLRKYRDDAFLGPKLEIIVKQAELMDEMLSGLRQFGRSPAGCPPRADPRAAVRAALDLLGERLRKARVQVRVDGVDCAAVVEVRCTPGQLQQVLVNLVTNALDALEPVHGGWIMVRLEPAASGLRLWFADSGPGIPEELREKVFEPFFTTKEAGHGTGLGLPICRDILRAAGGELRLLAPAEAAVALGERAGAAFALELPWAGPEGAAGCRGAAP